MTDVEDIQLPPELSNLSTIVDASPEVLATGSSDLQSTALNATKFIYDLALKSEDNSQYYINDLLMSISPTLAPETRSQSTKRKRSPTYDPADYSPKFYETPVDELHVDGMNDDQVWAQLELRAARVCSLLEYALDGTGDGLGNEGDEESAGSQKKRKMLLDDDGDLDMDDLDGMKVDSDEDEDEDGDEDEDDGDEDEDEEDEDEDEEEDEEEDLGEGVMRLRDASDDEENGDTVLDLDKPSILTGGKRKLKLKLKKGGHPELDDGFFDLATFNAETEEAEARAVSKGRLGKVDSDEEGDDDEGVDLFAPVDAMSDTLDGNEEGAAEPFYKDFFDLPPRPTSSKGERKTPAHLTASSSTGRVRFHEEVRVKNIKARGKNIPTAVLYDDPDDDDYEPEDVDSEEDDGSEEEGDEEDEEYGELISEDGSEENDEYGSNEDEEESSQTSRDDDDDLETIERFKDDLFAEEDEKHQTDMTAFEKRMAALREEIATMEAENVAKKNWTLMGEATSRSRPQNSLLEEDLEFERVMKSVPVITEETVQSLEERIKARILEGQFDDVVRKRPVDDKPFLPSRFFELQDTKSKQSLAEIYEDEYTAQTGGVAGEDRDGKLKKEHQELEKQWEQICGKLDALCNAHFTPKAPKASISTVANVAAASMESALPTTMSSSSMLAPEEVFAPPSTTDLRVRSELTPTEKRALHNKQKKAKKKARDVLEKSVDKFAQSKRAGGVKKQKEAALKSVVKSGKGVTVIGKKSKDVAGQRKRTET